MSLECIFNEMFCLFSLNFWVVHVSGVMKFTVRMYWLRIVESTKFSKNVLNSEEKYSSPFGVSYCLWAANICVRNTLTQCTWAEWELLHILWRIDRNIITLGLLCSTISIFSRPSRQFRLQNRQHSVHIESKWSMINALRSFSIRTIRIARYYFGMYYRGSIWNFIAIHGFLNFSINYRR